MGLKKILDKDVKVVLDGKAITYKGEGTVYSLEAEGHLSKKQPKLSNFLNFDMLTYKIYEQGQETTLKDVKINKKYLILIGKK